jgi:hypothetical protein
MLINYQASSKPNKLRGDTPMRKNWQAFLPPLLILAAAVTTSTGQVAVPPVARPAIQIEQGDTTQEHVPSPRTLPGGNMVRPASDRFASYPVPGHDMAVVIEPVQIITDEKGRYTVELLLVGEKRYAGAVSSALGRMALAQEAVFVSPDSSYAPVWQGSLEISGIWFVPAIEGEAVKPMHVLLIRMPISKRATLMNFGGLYVPRLSQETMLQLEAAIKDCANAMTQWPDKFVEYRVRAVPINGRMRCSGVRSFMD